MSFVNNNLCPLFRKMRLGGKINGSPIRPVPARFWRGVIGDNKMGIGSTLESKADLQF